MMSVGPLGMGGVAGAPLAQTKGTDGDRNAQEANSQERQTKSAELAQSADSIGATDSQEQTSDRDADGRRIIEKRARNQEEQTGDEAPREKRPARQSKDATGEKGNQLDLTG
ncbi:MAG: hypothetical protein QGG36_20200 [Pirellulaceae bacterium]|nr:hypothetical protein [Pirellulaceae bacterium]